MGNRIDYIDVAKGIGIILVVFGHSSLVLHVENIWIHSYHMPLFFFISGICFYDRKYTLRELIWKRWNQIIMPCIYFSFIIATIEMILRIREPETLLSNLPHALWFLPIMFLSQIIVAGLWKMILNPIGRYAIICIFIATWFCCANGQMIPYSLHALPPACFFFAVGNLLRASLRVYASPFVVIITFIGTLICVYILHSRLNLYENILIHPIVATVASICGILFVLGFSSIIVSNDFNRKIFTCFGKNTLAIMSIHQFLFNMSRHFLRPCISFAPPLFGKIDVLYGFVEITLCMCISVIIVTQINRKAKWLIGKNKIYE